MAELVHHMDTKTQGMIEESGAAGRAYLTRPRDLDEDKIRNMDDVVRSMFDFFMTKPTNKLSRSPAFKQYYWTKVAELMPWVNNDVRQQLLVRAKEAGIERGKLRQVVADLIGDDTDAVIAKLDQLSNAKLKDLVDEPLNGISNINTVDDVAKAFALEEVRGLLYDTTKRHEFWDQARHFAPFGEAWFEIASTWNHILQENPNLIRRAQQFIAGGRESNPIEALLNPDELETNQKGFFYSDPSTGDEIFNYPGWDLLAKWMFQTETPEGQELRPRVTGRAAGVNLLLGSFMPGVGPIIQIPTAGFGLFNNPDQDWVRELILPFGGEEATSIGEVVDSIVPSWVRKFKNAVGKPSGDQQRLYGNTIIDVLRMKIQAGEVKFDTFEDAQDAFAVAEKAAQRMYGIRAASQFFGPTSGSIRFDVRDKDGKLWAFQSLSSEYRRMLEEAEWDHDQAFRDFTMRFGLDPSLYYTSKSRSVLRRSVTEEGYDWQRRNPELFEEFPLTAYYVNPDAPEGEFDYDAYVEQLREGTRESLTPDQWAEERNDFLGRVAYEKARGQVTNSEGLRTDAPAVQWLRNYRYQLQVDYPGFDRVTVGLTENVPREQVIAEMEGWANSPDIMATDAGYATVQYLQARSQAYASAARLDISRQGFTSAKKTRYLRDWLRKVAESILMTNPDFGPVWEQVLSREIEERDEPQELLGVSFG